MKLITQSIKKSTPPIGTYRNTPTKDVKLHFKLFSPWGNWTWYVSEADFETGECYGYVIGFEKEWGYFSLTELQEIKGPFGLKIERDLHFTPKPFSELKE